MAVYLNSTPQEDGNPLNGGATVVGSLYAFNVVALREESQDIPQYLQLTGSGQFVGIFDAYGTYLTSGDTGFTFRWKFWARGTGTVALTQDVDPTWSTAALPAASIGNLVVSAGAWTLYHVDADPISLTDFLDFDAIRLGLDLTSGAVDITTIQLECVPDDPATGGWVSQPGYDNGPYTATATASAAGDGVFYTGNVDEGDALQTAVDNTLALDILNYAGTDSTPGAAITTGANSYARVNEDLFNPGDFVAETNMGASYLSVNVGVRDNPASPIGTEGVDYIRVPGFTLYDPGAYTRASNHVDPAYPAAVWQTPHIFFNRNLGVYQDGDYESLNLKVLVYQGDYQNPYATTGNFLPTGADLIYTIVPEQVDDDVIDPITLPSDGRFTFWTVAGTLRDGVGDSISIVDPSESVGVYFSGGIVVQSDDERDPLETRPLYYELSWPSYAQWSPTAVAPSWVRNIQRNDGLGQSQWRWRSYVTVNLRVVGVTFDDGSSSIRWRAIR